MKYFVIILLFGFGFMPLCKAQTTIWTIGEKNSSPDELALAPDNYKDFLKYDFGWEDKFYIIGMSTPKKDFPYILPGPQDAWGGSGGVAGLRTYVLNILFGMNEAPAGYYALNIGILNTGKDHTPLFKVTVNGKSWTYSVDSLGQDFRIPLEAGLIRKGGNEINLTVLEGSWVTFDYVNVEGPANAVLQKVNPAAYLRRVEAADYTVEGKQPLLVDVEHLSGKPRLTIKLDGKTMFEQALEQGRYVLEAAMPAVNKTTESRFETLIDGETVYSGTITRKPDLKPVTPADYVNTLAGTAHSRWMIAPGPWMPFSMVKLSPDNQNTGWQAGYQPSYESVGMFSHVHEWTINGLGMLPVTGELKTRTGDERTLHKQPDDYRSAIDKSSEEAPLGYYKVHLTDYNVTAELTATTRCGFQRYTYPKGSQARVMIELKVPAEYECQILASEIRQTSPRRIEGFSKQQSRDVWYADVHQDYTIHFVIDFDVDIKKFGMYNTGCYVEFDVSSNNVVQARSAISYVDMEGARKNLLEEVEKPFGWDFEAVCRNQRDTWNDLLERIQITSNDRREKVRFYTNLYRAFCRNIFSDVDGRWVDATERIQHMTGQDAVALGCDAFWNTFWNLNQLWNMIAPEWSSRWVRSQLAMYDANGWLAKGPAGMKYIPVMVAEHEIPLLVSAYQMGIRDYNTEKMFEAVKKMQTALPERIGHGLAGNRDLASYLKYHYVPADEGRFSNTLEYSFDDWTVAQLAKAMGKGDDYRYFADRGEWWRNAINPENGYAHLRYADGRWEKDFDPFRSGANLHYVEGNAWQLTFFVPQNVPALAEVIGRDRMLERLKWGFTQSEPWRYNAPGEQYWDFPVVQGNQQSMHFAFLFNHLGEPWETQRWTRSIIDRYYGFELANAYLGDEDQGQMSAWLVMAAIGLFQTDGGCSAEPVYEMASPLYEKIVINLGERHDRGKQFVIEAKNTSKENMYIQSATLNGNPLTSFSFPVSELLKGGKLTLIMGNKPNIHFLKSKP
ncbi:MAG: GH92 family glycosyl hydrolase [Dysgonamonadaceae bacterium]|jgi:predicted alpha-1,2-mannosidase|nr:GH92 family glycosyl hydrolase [Dysgonamonadaceae bacterium]